MKKLNFEEDLKILIDDLAKERGLVSLSQPLVYEEEEVISEDQFDELRLKIMGTVKEWLPVVEEVYNVLTDIPPGIGATMERAKAVHELNLESFSLKEGVDYYEEEK